MRLKFLPSFVKRRGRITKRQEKGLKLLNKYSISSVNDIKNEDKDILSQLNKLQDLLKSGVLTEDEFKKAKEKILN